MLRAGGVQHVEEIMKRYLTNAHQFLLVLLKIGTSIMYAREHFSAIYCSLKTGALI
jgi:hypothetical protein